VSCRDFVQAALLTTNKELWSAAFFSTLLETSPKGEVRTAVFLAREGHTLPEAESIAE
jgi:hypothetical protein